jgi:uncharacterized protein (TIGR00269 family)
MPSSCTLCKRRDAIYTRPYSGEKICSRCFCNSIEKKVKHTIAKHKMLRYDDKIAVGVSGGKDSMALLHILSKLEAAFPKAEIIAITVDEGISQYREEALEIVEEGCRRLQIESISVSFKEMFGLSLDELATRLAYGESKSGLTPCSYCGVLRRRALNNLAREHGAKKLVTAHNLDDEVQTALLNFFHGDPLRMARAGPVSPHSHPSFVQRVKPFSEVLERETTLYAYLKRIEFQSKPCPYASTALRTDIRTMLNRMEEKHAGLKYTVYRSAETVSSIIKSTVKSQDLKECLRCQEPTANEICQACKIIQDQCLGSGS